MAVFESLLHYLTTVVLSAYWHEGAPDTGHNRRLYDKFYRKGRLSDGDLMEMLRETVRLYQARPEALPYPRLAGYLFTSAGNSTASLLELERFLAHRNDAAHYGGRDYAALFGEQRPRLDQELDRCDWLATRELWRPTEVTTVAGTTVITRADSLNGVLRRRHRTVSLRLAPGDGNLQGDDVELEKTLLLVNRETNEYLPLFPFSLFHWKENAEGQFFLNSLEWAESPEPLLKKARYRAYHESLGQHEERKNEPAAAMLQERVRQLEEALPAQGAALHPVRNDLPKRIDYDLPEVWMEQASHLKSFAGRVDWLTRVREWVETTTEGGYFLLLGPPGQGKSALLAQFAHSAGAGSRADKGGCLLHMVKSHKNPRRFLQFLLWQAEQRLGESLGEVAYQGDIDDLRNALVRTLEKVALKHGQALVVLDALDELDATADRVSFLPQRLPQGVRVVLSCRPDMPLVDALRQRLEQRTEAELPPLQPEDLPQFLAVYLDAERVEELRRAVDFDALFQRMEGNPLFLQQALVRLLEETHQAQRRGVDLAPIDVATFPNTLRTVFAAIYDEIAGRVGGRPGDESGRRRARVFQLLVVAREALSITDLRDLLRAEGQRLTLEEVCELVMPMSEYLLVHEGDRFLPFHQGFTEYLRNAVLGEEGVAEAQALFGRWLNEPQQRRSWYALQHLAQHLEPSGALEELARLLTDFDYVRDKVELGLVFDLVRDYHAAEEAFRSAGKQAPSELEAWGRFMDSESHNLARLPELFFQQALNQATNSAVSQAAENRRRTSPPRRPYLRWVNKPEQAGATPLLRTLVGHSDPVKTVVVTPDGERAVSGSDDGTLKVWEVATGRCLVTMEGHSGPVRAVAVTPDGERAVSGSEDRTLKVWELASGRCLATLKGHGNWVEAVALTPDGERAVSASADGVLKGWELGTGRCLATLKGHGNWVTAVALTPGGDRAVSANRDGTLRAWELATGRYLAIMKGHRGAVCAVAVTLDGERAVSASADRTLRVWEFATGRCLTTMEGHRREVYAVAVTPGGERAVSASGDGTLRVWELATGRCLATLEGHRDGVLAVAVTPDGERAVSASRDRTVKVWELATQRRLATMEGHSALVTAVADTPDGKWVVSASLDRTLKVWELATGRCLGTLEGHRDGVLAVAVTPDGQWAVSAGADRTLRAWEFATGRCLTIMEGHRREVYAVAVTPDGKRVVSGSLDRTLKVWELATGRCLATLEGHRDGVLAVAVTPDGERAVSASRDRTVKMWELATGRRLATMEGHSELVTAVAVTLDGKRAVSASGDQTLKVWELASGRCLHTLQGHTRAVCGVTLTRDGRYAASVGADELLRLWYLAGDECVALYPGDETAVASFSFHAIVCGSATGRISVLRLEGL